MSREWLSFTSFREWFFVELSKTDMGAAEVCLDKDILSDSKVYSSDTCLLLTRSLNSLMNSRLAARGDLPQGVVKKGLKFRGQVSVGGKQLKKTFGTIEEASGWYVDQKIKLIKSIEIPFWLDEDLVRKRLLEIFERQTI